MGVGGGGVLGLGGIYFIKDVLEGCSCFFVFNLILVVAFIFRGIIATIGFRACRGFFPVDLGGGVFGRQRTFRLAEQGPRVCEIGVVQGKPLFWVDLRDELFDCRGWRGVVMDGKECLAQGVCGSRGEARV